STTGLMPALPSTTGLMPALPSTTGLMPALPSHLQLISSHWLDASSTTDLFSLA
ncbi:MAG: hypothetical protein F6K10_08000, partial [Moorea sp. SIO2B7]|nr:hypothetical protein [Moorena sp. SIO2B7]